MRCSYHRAFSLAGASFHRMSATPTHDPLA
jgi:hypothetical protein